MTEEINKMIHYYHRYMAEQMLNKLVNEILCALELKGIVIPKEKFYDLMYRNENIYQTVFRKCSNERKATLIWREMRKIIFGEKEEMIVGEMKSEEKLKFLIAEKKRERKKGGAPKKTKS